MSKSKCKCNCGKQQKHSPGHPLLSAFSVLLCLAAVASTAAFFLSRLTARKLHDEKWRDYDDCGVL